MFVADKIIIIIIILIELELDFRIIGKMYIHIFIKYQNYLFYWENSNYIQIQIQSAKFVRISNTILEYLFGILSILSNIKTKEQ